MPDQRLEVTEIIAIARQVVDRGVRRRELVQYLRDEDMLGLECAQTVELDKLDARDASDGIILADWIFYESIHGSRLR